MATLITGMSGFVGVALAEALVSRGERVVGFSRVPMPADALVAERDSGAVTAIEGDIRQRDELQAAFESVPINGIVHCAAVTANADRERRSAPEIIDVNVGGTARVLQLAAEYGVRRVVVAGSGSVYPDHVHPPQSILNEDVPQRPQSLYEISKSSAEAVAHRIADLGHLSLVIARLGQVFGPWERDTGSRDTLSPILQLTEAALARQPVTLPRPYLKNWHYCRDAAEALVTLLLAEHPRHRVYNIAPQATWPLTAWADLLAQRYPGFSYVVGDAVPGRRAIDLYGASDTALVSWQRYGEEFGPTARYSLETAFEDFAAWLGR